MAFKDPITLKNEAMIEAYDYFDRNIRPLKKDPNGKVDPRAEGLASNDVDAFRHAYVSGVFTQDYSESAARILGNLNELSPGDLYSNQLSPGDRNMDLWNNSVGRKYGKSTKDRKELAKRLKRALRKGELIITPDDKRRYKGSEYSGVSEIKPVIVLMEDKRGRNELFYDTLKQQVLSADSFISEIEKGFYPGYSVRVINGISTPVSRRDKRDVNNLG